MTIEMMAEAAAALLPGRLVIGMKNVRAYRWIALDRGRTTVQITAGEFDQPYARTHRLWREAKNFQRVILRNRGHLSSYMAGLCPELYRDALTDFVVRNNPRK